MKKMTFILMLLGILLVTVACAGEAVNTAPDTSAKSTEQTPAESSATAKQTSAASTTTEEMPRFLYPDGYTAELGSVQSCCSGVITDVRDKFDVVVPSLETYFSKELPEYFGDHSLTADSTEAERIAVLKTMLESFAEEKIDWDFYSVSVETEVRVKGIPTTYDSFVSVSDCAEGAEVNYTFVFTRTISGYPTQKYAKVNTEADGTVWFLSVVSAVNLERFGNVEIDREALDAVVQRLGGERVTVSATLCTGSKSLYLVVDAAKEMGDGTVHVETIASQYYILVATLPDRK